MIGFERRASFTDSMKQGLLGVGQRLSAEDSARVDRYRKYQNFYEGFHWEDMPEQDSPELTINFCRAFVNKFVAFELGKPFTFAVSKTMSGERGTAPKVTEDGRTLFEYLEDVWEINNQYLFTTMLGQMKSITGDAWIQASFYNPEDTDTPYYDPFGEYPDGRIMLDIIPTSMVFPEYDSTNHNILVRVTIMFMFKRTVVKGLLKKETLENTLFKQVITKDDIITKIGSEEETVVKNRYGIIPLVQIKNIPCAGKNEGISDLEDIIPMNTEYNLKKSNVSEILDYHSAPITLVYGAKIGNLEKGANKLWGGLAKDSRVENLELNSDLGSSSRYAQELHLAMCEVAGIPEASLGGAQAISNTSGVALEYQNLPLVEKTRTKRMSTEDGLERLNKLIIHISVLEALIKKPEGVPNREFYYNTVTIPDTLPKDKILELQQIETELRMGLELRENAMKRIGKEDIENLIQKIDADREKNPEVYGIAPKMDKAPQLNSGFTNGSTAIEQVRKEMTGSNGMT